MAHVTFVHGIANKPAADVLLRIWRDTLAGTADPLPLGDLGVTSSLVYWADLMYDRPDDDVAAHEGVLEGTPQAIDAGGGAAPPMPRTPEEAAFLAAMRRRLTTLSDDEIAREAAAAPADGEPGAQGTLERIPLPWFLKKPLMDVLLRDVHHYLFDVAFAPPGRPPPVPIQATIRRRLCEALSAPGITRPHVVVAHSMGTVIAYDCLKRLDGCATVDGLVTLGSPLGLDEVQDRLRPGWSREDGFPHERVAGPWVNLFDRLDPVCGFDPRFANDFRHGGREAVRDIAVQNPGTWRHSMTKYLRQPAFGTTLRGMLGV